MYWTILSGILSLVGSIAASTCVCTTVSCPISGENYITMGNGSANIIYDYELHGEHQVVTGAHGTILPTDLDYGTGTTSCTQKYSRMLDDDGIPDCDAGHILAHRLGGYGNQPLNIFPQDASINRGAYAQFESHIYDCMLNGTTMGNFQWKFNYKNITVTKPESVYYSVSFDGGNCDALSSTFTN